MISMLIKQSLYSSEVILGDFGFSLIFLLARCGPAEPIQWTPRMPLAEPLCSTEPQLKNTALDLSGQHTYKHHWNTYQHWSGTCEFDM